METIQITSLADLRSQLKMIREKYKIPSIDTIETSNYILFRGQADAEWPLKTTLERFTDQTHTMLSYAELVDRCVPQLETFTGQKWNLPPWAEAKENIKKKFNQFWVEIPDYELWVYLRHHGFPSPLLDWTRSPYIAAFFALEQKNTALNSAVYAYIRNPKGTRSNWAVDPQIHDQGPYVSTDKRHFLQQSWYTIAIQAKNQERQFVSHEDVFALGAIDQDVLFKFVLTRSKRIEILAELYEYNITHFSLFHSEEALARTLAFKEAEARIM